MVMTNRCPSSRSDVTSLSLSSESGGGAGSLPAASAAAFAPFPASLSRPIPDASPANSITEPARPNPFMKLRQRFAGLLGLGNGYPSCVTRVQGSLIKLSGEFAEQS